MGYFALGNLTHKRQTGIIISGGVLVNIRPTSILLFTLFILVSINVIEGCVSISMCEWVHMPV